MTNANDNIANLSANIKLGVDNRIKELHTCMPGIIQSFDPTTQLAEVQPAVRRVFRNEQDGEIILTPTNLPKLINVPVIYPRGGGFSLTFPVTSGDECLILFSERSIDTWHEFGKVSTPNNKRFHALSDAMCLVGLSSIPNKIPNYDPDNVTLKKDDDTVFIKVKDNGELELESETNTDITVGGDLNATVTGDIIATCTNIDVTASTAATVTAPISTFNGNVQVNGNITVTGVASAPTVTAATSLSVAGVEMSSHTHAQAPDSGGNTEVNTGPAI